jgi:hypothetical protein
MASKPRGTRLLNPVVVEHSDSIGLLKDKHVSASTLNATAIVLTSLGADQVIVPVPGEFEMRRAITGLEGLPPTRRNRIRLADENGKMISRE